MLISTLLAAALQTATPVAPASDDIAWGASLGAVQSAVTGRPPRSSRDDVNDFHVLWTARDHIDDVEVEALFYFDNAQSLEMVAFEAPYRQCRDVIASIVERFGRPVTMSDQAILRLIIWHDEGRQRRLRLLVSQAGICTLYYERLATYQAGDLAERTRP
ncbi:MAG TPA: hypothetical protein PLQ03_06835 [Brevundimonas sp.]|uniref:hypothetical protein n=1 Tax=Brevundimonas sp. TaxID=1871086 RepID=UPI002C278744|nr:hypothetical protein [Brevundimonas sp.]HRO33113.1 hypothetical protein [Brevundimonas sp.]